jgi:hypothetical protein
MSNNKQSSVERLVHHLIDYGFDLSLHQFEIEQAKAMHKEESQKIFECGRNFQLTGEGTFEEVYNETFGQ